MYTQLLHSLGLSTKEALVYETLLTTGEASIPTLVKQTGEKRGIVHFLLKNLTQKGLVVRKASGKNPIFEAESPYKLADLVKIRGEEIAQIQKSLADSLPSLISQYQLATNKPTIRYFEGKEGLKQVFNDIYAPNKPEVIGAADLAKIEATFPGFLAKSLIPTRTKGQIFSKAILSSNELSQQVQARDSLENRQSKLVEATKYPLPAEIDVYDDKVALLSFERGNFVGIIIQNQEIATSLKSILELAFKQLPNQI